MDFPVVVKTCCGGSSIGVYIVDNQEDYTKALDGAFTYENEVVVEEFVEGVEYTVAVVDGKAYPVVQIVPVQGFYDYENKYKPGAVKEKMCIRDRGNHTLGSVYVCNLCTGSGSSQSCTACVSKKIQDFDRASGFTNFITEPVPVDSLLREKTSVFAVSYTHLSSRGFMEAEAILNRASFATKPRYPLDAA